MEERRGKGKKGPIAISTHHQMARRLWADAMRFEARGRRKKEKGGGA